MSQFAFRKAVARNWVYFKTGVLGVLPLAIFGLLLVVLFLRSNLFQVSAFFDDTTGWFNAVLYIAVAVWAGSMAVRNGRRLYQRQQLARLSPGAN